MSVINCGVNKCKVMKCLYSDFCLQVWFYLLVIIKHTAFSDIGVSVMGLISFLVDLGFVILHQAILCKMLTQL